MAILSVLAATAVAAIGGFSLLAVPDEGFTWSKTPPSYAEQVVFVPEGQAFFEIPYSYPENQVYPTYYVSQITRDELPANFSFDASKFPSHGPGWVGVYESIYVVREALLDASGAVSSSSAWLACYFQLGLGNSGYYPVYSDTDSFWTFPAAEFPALNAPLSGENVGWLYNFGVYLVDHATFFADILDFEIFGHKFIYLIATSAIFVYMGWCVVKFAIGL